MKKKRIINGLILIEMLVLELLPNSNAFYYLLYTCDDIELMINCRPLRHFECTSFFDIEIWNTFGDLFPLIIGILTCICLIISIYDLFKPNRKVEISICCCEIIIFIFFLFRIATNQGMTWIGDVITILAFISSMMYLNDIYKGNIIASNC